MSDPDATLATDDEDYAAYVDGYSTLALEAVAFLRAHDPAVAKWALPNLLDWFAWFWRGGHVGVVRIDGQVAAVAVARCVRDLDEAQSVPYAHHEAATEGALLWVDQLASTHPLGLPLLLAQARSRFGPRDRISGQVFKRPGELRMLPWSRVVRLLHHHGLH